MFKKREYTVEKFSVIFQVILSLACFVFVWWFGISPSDVHIESVNELRNSLIIIAVLWLLLLSLFKLGKLDVTVSYFPLFVAYVKPVLVGVLSLYVFNFYFGFLALGIKNLLIFGIFNLLVLITYKKSFFTVMHFFSKKRDYSVRRLLLIADEGSSEYIEKIIRSKDWRYNVHGIMTNCKDMEEKYKNRFKIISESKRLDELFHEENIDELIYCKSKYNQNEIHRYISNCAEVGIFFHHYNGKAQNKNESQNKLPSFYLIDQLPLVTYKNTPDHYFGLKMKNIFDIFISSTAIILGSPIFLIIAIAIQLEGGGPVFFKQERVGLNGRRFLCFKFRTMAIGSEVLQASLLGQNEQDGPVFKITNDPRVTYVGRFLRKTSLDELPQFVNVLRGEMSVVGPRPPVPTEVEKYEQWQKRRLSVKPGITCTWQVSGRNNIPFEQWMRLDLEYIDNWSLTKDVAIVFKTIKTVITANGR